MEDKEKIPFFIICKFEDSNLKYVLDIDTFLDKVKNVHKTNKVFADLDTSNNKEQCT